GAGELTIGAGVTYSEMLAVEELPTLLRQAVERIAAPGLRNRATMAGNLCNASPAADCLPPLYVHEATVRVSSVRGERVIPIAEFPTGPRTTVLEADEIVSAVTIPHLPAGRLYYRKVGTRKANALSKLSAAGYARMSGERIEEFRFAVGAVAPTVVRLSHAEELLRGARRGEVSLEAVLEAAEGAMKPIDDQRSTATYRREVALNALREFLSELLESDTSEET
ncbi:MAG: FAD binding domain-containing protein, partial [Spirochaetota bacterium]